MLTTVRTLITIGLILLSTLTFGLVMLARLSLDPVLTGSPAAAQTQAPEPRDRTKDFDYLVRADMFAGMAGDQARFDRAMKLCEDTLAHDPNHPEALVWRGSGFVLLASRAFQASEMQKGAELWQRGLAEMDLAVALAPDKPGVLVPRGSVLLQAGMALPAGDQSRGLIAQGLRDFERVLELQRPTFAQRPIHARGELLAGLADGWQRLGRGDRAREYARRIVAEVSDSAYATKAQAWLARGPGASEKLSCTTGCHAP